MGRALRIARNWIVTGVIALALAWVCLTLFLPTDALRDRIQSEIAGRTGQPTQVASVGISPLGQVTVSGVSLGQAETPWLKIDHIDIPLDLASLVGGSILPRHCRLAGAQFVGHRDVAGAWTIGPRLEQRAHEEFVPRDDHNKPDAEPNRLEIEISQGSLQLDDEQTGTQIELTNLNGQASWEPDHLIIEQLSGRMAGGQVTLATQLKRDGDQFSLEGTLKATEVGLSQNVGALSSFFLPMLADRSGGLTARLVGETAFRTHGQMADDLRSNLEGTAEIHLEDLQLSGSRLLEDVSQLLKIPPRTKLGRATGTFLIKNERISTQNLSIHASGTPILLAGWTDFDGQLDYRIKSEVLATRINELADQLPPEARRLAQDLNLNLNAEIDRLTELRLQGTRDDLRLLANGGNQTAKRDDKGEKAGLKIDLERASRNIRDLGARPAQGTRR